MSSNPRTTVVKPCRPTALGRQVRNAAGLLVAALREIFDESAYTRFLERRQVQSSREAYAAFLQEHGAAKARRPKCC